MSEGAIPPSLKTGSSPGGDGQQLVYDTLVGHGPTVLFLHGLNSDRRGTKAQALAEHCARSGQAFFSFDMFGHGQSSGRFQDGSISRWAADAAHIIDTCIAGPVLVVGSSMGGWVALKAALARPQRVIGLIGIAAAPDFTEDLMYAHLSPQQKQTLTTQGYIDLPSEYADQPYRISAQLIEDGRRNLLLRNAINITCPVRLMHGQCDASVPWATALKIADQLTTKDVEILLIKDGDHRLSRPADLRHLCTAVDQLSSRVTS